MIYDIWENTQDNRCQISRLEAKDLDQCVKMVLDYYVKPEFHDSSCEDFIDDKLSYLTIPDPDIDDEEDFESSDLTFEIHVSDDQTTKSFKMISGHDEFLTLEKGEIKTPFSLGKLLDQSKKLGDLLD